MGGRLVAKTELQKLFRSCRAQPDGFVAPKLESAWRLGAVVLVACQGAFAVVQKASAGNNQYEFAGLLALPGGMVRVEDWLDGRHDINVEALTVRSLNVRLAQEISLRIEDRSEIVPTDLGPIVTSYFAKGAQRFTLIVTHTCEVAHELPIRSHHLSIDKAFWMPFGGQWHGLAPANCVAIAHLVWNRICLRDQALAKPYVEEAIGKCAAWGKELGWPHLPAPWAHANELARWRSAWAGDEQNNC
jgi:hypothetical protein